MKRIIFCGTEESKTEDCFVEVFCGEKGIVFKTGEFNSGDYHSESLTVMSVEVANEFVSEIKKAILNYEKSRP